MNKAQKAITVFLIAAFLVVAVLSIIYFRVTGEVIKNPEINGTILYYGETCPHCKIVDEFIANNSIETRMNITHKEIFNNAANAEELRQVATECGLDLKNVGVPFLYTEGKCYVGDKDIIDFLSQELNITASL